MIMSFNSCAAAKNNRVTRLGFGNIFFAIPRALLAQNVGDHSIFITSEARDRGRLTALVLDGNVLDVRRPMAVAHKSGLLLRVNSRDGATVCARNAKKSLPSSFFGGAAAAANGGMAGSTFRASFHLRRCLEREKVALLGLQSLAASADNLTNTLILPQLYLPALGRTLRTKVRLARNKYYSDNLNTRGDTR